MNLEKFKVQELGIHEQKNIEGGWLGYALIGAMLLVGIIFALDGNKNTGSHINTPYGSIRVGN